MKHVANLPKSFKCETCGKCIHTKPYRDLHSGRHKNEKRYKFKICIKSFQTKQGLTNHQLTHKPVKRHFSCGICDKIYSSITALYKHIKHTHELPKAVSCVFCGAVLTEKSSLFNHLLRHIDERRFRCELCNKSFTSFIRKLYTSEPTQVKCRNSAIYVRTVILVDQIWISTSNVTAVKICTHAFFVKKNSKTKNFIGIIFQMKWEKFNILAKSARSF